MPTTLFYSIFWLCFLEWNARRSIPTCSSGDGGGALAFRARQKVRQNPTDDDDNDIDFVVKEKRRIKDGVICCNRIRKKENQSLWWNPPLHRATNRFTFRGVNKVTNEFYTTAVLTSLQKITSPFSILKGKYILKKLSERKVERLEDDSSERVEEVEK